MSRRLSLLPLLGALFLGIVVCCRTITGFALIPQQVPVLLRRPVEKTIIADPLRVPHRILINSIKVHSLSSALESSTNSQEKSVRSRLRRWTGFSLTALRQTARAATGISLTAVYASTLAASGIWIRQTMKCVLSMFPAWLRYFVQPFLVMYYVPLFLLRNLSSPSNQNSNLRKQQEKHDAFIRSWKEAVETADKTSSYWPLHVTECGDLEQDMFELDTNEAVADSIEVAATYDGIMDDREPTI